MKTEKISIILFYLIVFALIVLGGFFCILALFPGCFDIPTSHWGIKRSGLLLAGIILLLASASTIFAGKGRLRWMQFVQRKLTPGVSASLNWIISRQSDLFYHLMEILILLTAVFLFWTDADLLPGNRG